MAELSQRFIDLLNVPLDVLKELAEEKKVPGFASMSKWALAQHLDRLSRADLERKTKGFLYAGRTSVTYFRFDHPPKKPDGDGKKGAASGSTDGDGAAPPTSLEELVLEGVPLKRANVDRVLRELGNGNPFNEAKRPSPVTRDPQLVFARRRPDESVVMTFVVEGTVARFIHNFAMSEAVGDEFFSAVLYPASGIVEVRTNQETAHRFGRSWLETFATSLGLQAYGVSITEGDFKALATELDAGTAAFRGKNTSGGAVDTVEVRMVAGAATLLGDKTFESKVANTEQQLGDLIFDHGTRTYRIRVSRIRGSIFFIAPAPEAVLDHVRNALRTVKVRHRTSN